MVCNQTHTQLRVPACYCCCCSCCSSAAGSRYLSSDISFFGVGSKNAAFYLGRIVKVVTKTQDSTYVHELCIQGARSACCVLGWQCLLC